MKKLVLVRHGHAENGQNNALSKWGKGGIEYLAEKLKAHLDGRVIVLSSSALRTTQTAEIIKTAFNLPDFSTHNILWTGCFGKAGDGRKEFEEVLMMIKDRAPMVDAIILVVHHEYVLGFPQFFGQHYLGASLMGAPIEKGTAWLINCETKEMVHVE